MDGPSVLASDGPPSVFAEFDVTGRLPPLSEVGSYHLAQEPVSLDTAPARERQDELPPGADIVAFPELPAS